MNWIGDFSTKRGCNNAESLAERYFPQLLIILLVLAMFMLIELRHPYFFFQDDNRGQNLPYYIHNIKSIAAGDIPLFNFHQFLGTAHLACMQPATFYPINYIGLLLSKLMLGHFYGGIEFIALLHLMIAALGVYYYARNLGCSAIPGIFGGITWAFCGFVASVGNSWIFITGFAAWLPWLLLYSSRLTEVITLHNFVLLATVRLMILFIGHPQFFIYTVLFDCIIFSLMFRGGARVSRGRDSSNDELNSVSWVWVHLVFYANYLLVLLLALPFVLPALHQLSISAMRQQPMPWEDYISYSFDLGQWLNSFLMPMHEPNEVHFNNLHYIGHFGYIALLLAIIPLFQTRHQKFGKLIIAMLIAGGISLLWSADIVVARIIYYIPYLNRMKGVFKLGFFVDFFMGMLALIGLQIIMERLASRPGLSRRLLVNIGMVLVLVQAVNLLIYHTVTPQRMFSQHLDPIPLADSLRDKLTQGRIVTIGLDNHLVNGRVIYGNSLLMYGFDYATLFGLYHFAGYEVMLAEANARETMGLNGYAKFTAKPGQIIDLGRELPLDKMRNWGVKWYIVDRLVPVTVPGNFTLLYSDKNRDVFHDSLARPFIFWSDGTAVNELDYKFSTNSVEIVPREQMAGDIIINVLYNHFFNAEVDGKETSITETAEAQMLVRIPRGSHKVVITYRDPYYYTGVAISGAVIAFILSGMIFFRFRKSTTVQKM